MGMITERLVQEVQQRIDDRMPGSYSVVELVEPGTIAPGPTEFPRMIIQCEVGGQPYGWWFAIDERQYRREAQIQQTGCWVANQWVQFRARMN